MGSEMCIRDRNTSTIPHTDNNALPSLKLFQFKNFHIRIKLGNGHSINAIHIVLLITLKIPFQNGCIPENNHALYITLPNSTFPIPIRKPSDYLSNAFISRTITLTVNNIVAKNLFYSINIFIRPTLKIFSNNLFLSAFTPSSSQSFPPQKYTPHIYLST